MATKVQRMSGSDATNAADKIAVQANWIIYLDGNLVQKQSAQNAGRGSATRLMHAQVG